MRKWAVIVVIVLGVAIFALWPRHGTVTIDVTGTAGAKFTGTCTADGAARDLSGTVPAHFSVEGHEIAWTIVPAAAGPDFTVAMDVGGMGGKVVGASPTEPARGDVT